MKLLLISVAVVLAAGVGGALIWLDWHFEEPRAKHVPSLVRHLEAKSVLAVFAHPDDEQAVAGLLVDAATHDGGVARMITATKGEAGTSYPRISRQQDLGVIRHAEVLKNGYALGLQEQEVWDYPDGGLADVPFEALVTDIAARIRRWRPDLVVTFDPGKGFTMHPDHMAVGRATVAALRVAAEPDAKLSHTAPFAPRWLAYIIAPSRIMKRLGGERGREIAANQPVPNYSAPSNTAAKLRGWSIHESQSGFVQAAYRLPPWLLHRLYDKEHYYVSAVSGLLR